MCLRFIFIFFAPLAQCVAQTKFQCRPEQSLIGHWEPVHMYTINCNPGSPNTIFVECVIVRVYIFQKEPPFLKWWQQLPWRKTHLVISTTFKSRLSLTHVFGSLHSGAVARPLRGVDESFLIIRWWGWWMSRFFVSWKFFCNDSRNTGKLLGVSLSMQRI